jgi:hypothetical protein
MTDLSVWKFPLSLALDEQEIAMPVSAKILTMQMQHGSPMLWALVDPSAPISYRRVRIAGTGHLIKQDRAWEYVATFQMHGGDLVFHVFAESLAAPTEER